MKIHVVLEKDEDGYFVAEVPGMPGCLSQGRTLEEAAANIKEAAIAWKEVMASKDQSSDGEKVEVTVREEPLKLVSGKEAVRKFKRAGWKLSPQIGPHMKMTNPAYQWALAIPDHRQLGPGLLRKLLREANMTVSEFNSL